MMKKIVLTTLALIMMSTSASFAAGSAEEPPKQDWSFSGIFGTYDRGALQRGLKVYREVCSACHSLDRVAFRNLADFGYNEEQLKSIASEYVITDGPDEEGEMFERAGRPSDYFPAPYPNVNAAKAANGVAPPDLSLITKARHGGADYVYGILTGYEAAPDGHHLASGQYWNKYMSGHVIAMPAPLTDELVEYTDGTPMSLEQYARDVSHFLTWAAEPELERRKKYGIAALIFLCLFACIMYGVKKKIWADVKH